MRVHLLFFHLWFTRENMFATWMEELPKFSDVEHVPGMISSKKFLSWTGTNARCVVVQCILVLYDILQKSVNLTSPSE